LTPAPANVATLTVDGVFVPPTLALVADVLLVPSYYQDALTWYTITMIKFADDTQANQDQRNFAEGKYQGHLKNLRTTIRQYMYVDEMTLVRTDRWKYGFGRRTVGGSNSV
jgi:hypothetical protein